MKSPIAYRVAVDTTEMLVQRMNERQLEQWHERAAIIEYSGNTNRSDAEYIAALDVMRDIFPRRKGAGK